MLQHVSVREIMRTDMVMVSPDAGMVELLSTFIEHPGDTLFVTDDDHRLRGLVTASQIRPVMRNPSTLEGLVIAEDVMAHDGYPRVSPDRSVAEVMRFLEEYRGEVPVVEEEKLVGTIWPEDVIERYNEEVFKRDMAGSMASAVGSEPLAPVPALHNTVVGEVLVPNAFAGRTISELRIRQTYGVSVLARAHRVPFYVVAPVSTFDLSLADGSMIPIEERPAEEVTRWGDRVTAPEGIAVYNPAFDVTPADLISGIITDKGLIRPPYPENLARLAG